MYCHHCGKKLPIEHASFCNFCGTSLSSLANVPEPPPSKQTTQASFTPFVANGEDDDDYNKYDHMDRLPKLVNGLELEVATHPVGYEKLGTVMASGPIHVEQRDRPYSKVSDKKFLKQFAEEAGGPTKK